MVYTLDEIKRKIRPIAVKYNLPAVYVFGSYARNEATENSDVDILADITGAELKGLFAIGGLYNDLCASFDKKVDFVTTDALTKKEYRKRIIPSLPTFEENIEEERVVVYEH
ncbi:MAG: nucleotidyltransferase domain-containing protein [Oscillospiraceae bacterium]|nr:nucleotidyltransferase domain-containing protein [Oscillospiraceae bacterium]